jgi:hypothetical protein
MNPMRNLPCLVASDAGLAGKVAPFCVFTPGEVSKLQPDNDMS